eukprot:Phypoly_transcript_09299.p1 GENE.Phypoly_transcript_09299~~Phypoly_transcript_09299.p1  ORF type:complete len:415 (+),score=36.99 Phypoly_transcript_09299:118-1362(+)
MVHIPERLKESQFYLLCQYCVFTLIVGFQITRILYYRHALVSFQLGFLILCFIWGILRIIFWSTVSVTGVILSNVLLWIPLNIQFATFSLLVIFYAHLVHKSTWERYTKRRFAIAYVVINAVLLILQCVSLGVVNSKHPDDLKLLGDVQQGLGSTRPGYFICTPDRFSCVLHGVTTSSGIAGFVFLVLVAILAWYGFRLHVAISSTAKHQMLFQVPPGLFVVTVIIILLFLSRCIYDFVNVTSTYVVDLDSNSAKDQLIIFFAYFSWEIVPAIMIIVLFWRIPTTHIGGITRRGRSTMFMLPPTAVKPMPSAGIVSRLFNDPQRYDSDDETTGFLQKGTPVTYTTPPKPSSYTYSFGKNTPYATTPNTPRDLPNENAINNQMLLETASNANNIHNNTTQNTTPVENSSIIPGNA